MNFCNLSSVGRLKGIDLLSQLKNLQVKGGVIAQAGPDLLVAADREVHARDGGHGRGKNWPKTSTGSVIISISPYIIIRISLYKYKDKYDYWFLCLRQAATFVFLNKYLSLGIIT